MPRRTLYLMILLLILFICLVPFLYEDHFLLVSMGFVILSLVPFLLRFEGRKISSREIVLIAILAAIAAVSRVPFAAIPSVQPTTFVIILSSLVFGAETGFMIGATAALVSNLFLGQGPWTPWQMLSWGLVGFTAGLLKDTWWMKKRGGQWVFGFVWGFLFGWVMNLSIVLSFLEDFSWSSFAFTYLSSALFDLMHACSNVFFLAVFGPSWLRILQRFKRKYGLLS
ncbi:ECF transporter S component [Ammoniphilus resinae]|uniref:Energy-coupling factor transport system substrate-specific component n=1 Tax=Ammoniphilus resinae TaxID=861532 RepID=A0ABS4GQK8_9BACL|nr:ECF transporter S component [Ammoniphilus resinae]MBP1932538.1 energy-coupling factor transport system substrate-specific component [Ammoniphilus resinae]